MKVCKCFNVIYSMRKVILFYFVFILGVLNVYSGEFVKARGFVFIDTSGNEIIFKGIGLGGWLVPEGYMLRMPGYGSPTSIKEMIEDLIGEKDTEEFFKLYRKYFVQEKDIKRIAELGFNSIRIPLHYALFTDTDMSFSYNSEGIIILDSLLSWCKRYGLYLILDLHCAPGGQNPGNISDSPGRAELWIYEENKDKTVEFWDFISERYKEEKAIAGYDLLNEPVLPEGYSTNDLRELYIRIKDEIRENGDEHILFIEGNWYATDFSNLEPPFDLNMSYAFHKYWNEPIKSSITSYLDMSLRSLRPLWLGEFGENSNHWFSKVIDIAENNNISWNWWTYKKIDATSVIYSVELTREYQRILDYWNERASKPSPEFAKLALFNLAKKLDMDSCEFRRDVVAALLDDDFKSVNKPFEELNIPGLIPAVYYDLGGNGIAYSDNEYQMTTYPNWVAWNKGGRFRNDGVDIEESEDVQGVRYSIGWIEDGEWLKYSVDVATTGIYNLEIRVATPNDGCKMSIYIDENPLVSEVKVPNTGGWKIWNDIIIDSIRLEKGMHELKVLFVRGGFNFEYLKFELIYSSVYQNIENKIFLNGNYPNPFNNVTAIPIVLNEKSEVKVDIYSVEGRLVKNLYKGEMGNGLNILRWNGLDNFGRALPSGVYFYRISCNGISEMKKMLLLR